jgi:hypothetical protein
VADASATALMSVSQVIAGGLALKKHWELANARTWFPEEM